MLICDTLVSKWMEYIRNNPSNAYRFSECFWPSQMISKDAAITILEKNLEWTGEKKTVYIFGGWYGIFAELLYSKYPHKYINVDIDPSCEEVFIQINTTRDIIHLTEDMKTFKYKESPYMVINTSTEHISQEVYDMWWNNIPKGTKYLIQGNNFFESKEHIRCTETLDEFLKTNHVENCKETDMVYCHPRSDGSPFYRFMAMGIK